MKTIAAVIAGLLLSFMTFVGGLLTSSIYLDVDKPHRHLAGQDATALWTSEPVTIDRDHQSLKRLPARPVPEKRQVVVLSKAVTSQAPQDASSNVAAAVDDPQPKIDPVTTTAIDPGQTEPKTGEQVGQNTAHVGWCSRHYRSYQVSDNTYRSYSGNRRACESPYSKVVATDVKPANADDGIRETVRDSVDDDSEAELEQASFIKEPAAETSDDHVQWCLRRYRSYRVEDNTYQPFDGGPRRPCL
jgi:hypothetical protein